MDKSEVGKRAGKEVKANLLKEMYMSVNRMHEHMVNDKQEAARAERWHQRAIRKDFERLNESRDV